VNKRLIEELIPLAIEKLESGTVGIVMDNKIPKTFNGYIASFAASVVQAGLRQSVLFYSEAKRATKEDRCKITVLIYEVLGDKGLIDKNRYESLSSYVNDRAVDQVRAKGYILDAAAACKMAIRSFELTGS